MGFIDVFKALPHLIRCFYHLAKTILSLNPSVVVTIDYPGFNLRLARYLKKKGFKGKLVHFICPSVWAWGKKRIPLMEKTLDLLLCILPFENKFFSRASLQVEFVGHPLCERLQHHTYKPLPFSSSKHLVSLFPGSRLKEVERNLPLMLQALNDTLGADSSYSVAISLSDDKLRPLIEEILEKHRPKEPPFLVPGAFSYELMKHSHLAIAKSGTVTLELALHGVPTVVIYAISWLDEIIAYHILRIRLPFYCLVNIIAGREIFPELFGSNLSLESLKKEIELMRNEKKRDTTQKLCSEITNKLGAKKTSQEASSYLLQLHQMQCKNRL